MKKGLITSSNHQVIQFFRNHLQIALSTTETEPCVVVSPGGADVDPRYYGDVNVGQSRLPDREKDYKELCIFNAARYADIPIIGICRGFQLLGIFTGSRLIQDLPSHKRYQQHTLLTMEGTRIEGTVNSTHHQGVPSEHGERMEFALQSSDGNLELMLDKKLKLFGTQFHPEYANYPGATEVTLFKEHAKSLLEK